MHKLPLVVTTNKQKSTQFINLKKDLQSIFQHAVSSVSPAPLIRKNLKMSANILTVGDITYKLDKNCYIIGFGKAVFSMACEAAAILDDHLQGGVISIPIGIQEGLDQVNTPFELKIGHIKVYKGARNNLPDAKSLEAAQKIRDLVLSLGQGDLLLILISGGGSALLPAPKEPITLSEKCQLIQDLASAGANIMEINTVRKKLSDLKGGGLAKLAHPAKMVSLVLSDVIGDPIDFIASGPTVPNLDSSMAAKKIVEKYKLNSKLPQSIKKILDGSEHHCREFPRVQNVIIGNNKLALMSASNHAKSLGYAPFLLSDTMQGPVIETCRFYYLLLNLFIKVINEEILPKTMIEMLNNSSKLNQSSLWLESQHITEAVSSLKEGTGLCFIAGGEPTVVVTGSGKGGRNQELALRLAVELEDLLLTVRGYNVMFLSAGTDGIDGPTDAAGAYAYPGLVHAADQQGLHAKDYIYLNNSYEFYSRFQSFDELLLKTGHTGTNVMDIQMLMICPEPKWGAMKQ